MGFLARMRRDKYGWSRDMDDKVRDPSRRESIDVLNGGSSEKNLIQEFPPEETEK